MLYVRADQKLNVLWFCTFYSECKIFICWPSDFFEDISDSYIESSDPGHRCDEDEDEDDEGNWDDSDDSDENLSGFLAEGEDPDKDAADLLQLLKYGPW